MDPQTTLTAFVAATLSAVAFIVFERRIRPWLKKREAARERALADLREGQELLLSKQLDALHAHGGSMSLFERNKIMRAHGFEGRKV